MKADKCKEEIFEEELGKQVKKKTQSTKTNREGL
jgi:hypothetical protein